MATSKYTLHNAKSEFLSKQRDKHTDVSFDIQGVIIKAHQFVLSTHSSIFEIMFYGEFKKDLSKPIVLDDEPETFKMMIDYLYGISIQCNLDHFFDILQLADFYQIENLKE